MLRLRWCRTSTGARLWFSAGARLWRTCLEKVIQLLLFALLVLLTNCELLQNVQMFIISLNFLQLAI